MSDKDFTRDATERAIKAAGLGMTRLKLRIPTGPAHITMSDSEIQRNLRQPTADKVAAFIDLIGQDEVTEMLARNRDVT